MCDCFFSTSAFRQRTGACHALTPCWRVKHFLSGYRYKCYHTMSPISRSSHVDKDKLWSKLGGVYIIRVPGTASVYFKWNWWGSGREKSLSAFVCWEVDPGDLWRRGVTGCSSHDVPCVLACLMHSVPCRYVSLRKEWSMSGASLFSSPWCLSFGAKAFPEVLWGLRPGSMLSAEVLGIFCNLRGFSQLMVKWGAPEYYVLLIIVFSFLVKVQTSMIRPYLRKVCHTKTNK